MALQPSVLEQIYQLREELERAELQEALRALRSGDGLADDSTKSESTSMSVSYNPSSVDVANISAQSQLLNTLLGAYTGALGQNFQRPTGEQVGAGLGTLQGAQDTMSSALSQILGVAGQGIEKYSPGLAAKLRSMLAGQMAGEREGMFRGAFGAAGTGGGRGGRFASAMRQNTASAGSLADAYLNSSIDAANAEGVMSSRLQGIGLLPQAVQGNNALAQAIANLQTTPVQSEGFVGALGEIPNIVGGFQGGAGGTADFPEPTLPGGSANAPHVMRRNGRFGWQ